MDADASPRALPAREQQHARELDDLYGHDGFLRSTVLYLIAQASHAFMHRFNTTHVEGAHHLAAALARPTGTPLVTVCNHVASMDDPLVMASVTPPELFSRPADLRWTLCASDRCFHRAALVPFFRAAKVLPVQRGAGMSQPGLAAAEARLAAGEWVHVFPEGTRSKDGSLGPVRKGVGRLVAAAAAAAAGGGADAAAAPAQTPLVVPFVHSGMERVMPRGALLPRSGHEVRVLVGAPVPVADLLAAAPLAGWSEDELYVRIANRVGAHLHALRAQLEGVPLEEGARRALEADGQLVSDQELYDAADARHCGGPARWRWGGAQHLWERLDFVAQHRAWTDRCAGRGSGTAAPAPPPPPPPPPGRGTGVDMPSSSGDHGAAGADGSAPRTAPALRRAASRSGLGGMMAVGLLLDYIAQRRVDMERMLAARCV